MTITRVSGQAGGATGAVNTSASKAFASNVTAGNLILIFGGRFTQVSDAFVAGDCTKTAGTATLGTISLDCATEYNLSIGVYFQVGIWSAQVTGTGSCTMQVAVGASISYVNIGVNEYNSDIGLIEFLSGSNKTATGTTGAPATPSATSSRNAVFAGSLITDNLGVTTTITPGSTYTQIYEEEDGSQYVTTSCEDKLVGATSSTADWQAPTTLAWVAGLAVYEEPSVYSITESDGMTVGESNSVEIADALSINKSDGITLGESSAASSFVMALEINKTDTIFVSDARFIGWADYDISVTDGVTVGEAETVTLPDDLAVNVTDGVTLGESSAASIGALADYEINASDGLTLGESNAQALDDLAISKSEGVTVGDTGTAALADALAVSRSDGVTVGEAASAVLESFISKSEGVTVGEAASADLRAAWYNPDVLTVNTGSVVSGTIEDTWSDNGVKLQLAEVTGTPGFDYDFIFYGVPADAYSITINGYYQGNAGHNVKIRQYNFTTEAWTDLSPDTDDFPSTTSDQDYQFALFGGANYNSGGEVRIKIIHTTAGSVTHNFYIDQMLMSAQNLAVHVPDEGVTLGESWAAAIADDLAVSISDGVTLGEAAQANVSEIGALDISVSDGVTVGDGGAIAIGDLGIAIDPAYLIYWTAGVEVV